MLSKRFGDDRAADKLHIRVILPCGINPAKLIDARGPLRIALSARLCNSFRERGKVNAVTPGLPNLLARIPAAFADRCRGARTARLR